jgi:hypothetical protein
VIFKEGQDGYSLAFEGATRDIEIALTPRPATRELAENALVELGFRLVEILPGEDGDTRRVYTLLR